MSIPFKLTPEESMGYPRPSTIAETLDLDSRKADRIRAILVDECEGPTPKLETINEVLGMYGVEYISEGRNQKSPSIMYCNTGDPYNPTVMLIRGRFVLGCWGDIVERGNYD